MPDRAHDPEVLRAQHTAWLEQGRTGGDVLAAAAALEEEPNDLPPAKPAAPSAPKRSAAYLHPMPFGTSSKGKPLGELSEKVLTEWYKWAQEQTEPSDTVKAFLANAEALLEERRNDPDPFG